MRLANGAIYARIPLVGDRPRSYLELRVNRPRTCGHDAAPESTRNFHRSTMGWLIARGELRDALGKGREWGKKINDCGTSRRHYGFRFGHTSQARQRLWRNGGGV